MPADYLHIDWPEAEADARELVRLALAEDLASGHDMTTEAVVPADREGRARVVARESGIVCGLPIGPLVRTEAEARFDWSPAIADGDRFEAGACLATIAGPARELLTCERTLLNFIGRLSGVATQARRYADAAGNTDAEIYDTRKTTPGWRRLEKYAVACGGGRNHRTGL
ncbi:MAG: nicotinate-nucleotide diphosphorylase (carboxylating), partial [Planctomycetota bacterium]